MEFLGNVFINPKSQTFTVFETIRDDGQKKLSRSTTKEVTNGQILEYISYLEKANERQITVAPNWPFLTQDVVLAAVFRNWAAKQERRLASALRSTMLANFLFVYGFLQLAFQPGRQRIVLSALKMVLNGLSKSPAQNDDENPGYRISTIEEWKRSCDTNNVIRSLAGGLEFIATEYAWSMENAISKPREVASLLPDQEWHVRLFRQRI